MENEEIPAENPNQEEEVKSKKDDEKTETIPFHRLFSFADSVDILLMALGGLGAVGNGMSLPLMTVLFGQLIDSFGQNQNDKNVVHEVSKVSN